VLVRFALLLLLSNRPEALMDHEEGVRGNDSALPALGEQPVVSQAGIVDETSFSDPSGVFRPSTSMCSGSNIDRSQPNFSDQSTQTGQGSSGSSRAEAQICVYFLMIAETSLA
jgi:hypothetical protein